jgi:large subunit ribosomal protein L30
MSELLVTQRRSRNGANRRQLATLRSLGLRRIGHTVEVRDTAAARGMLHAVRHLVSVQDPSAGDGGSARRAKSQR